MGNIYNPGPMGRLLEVRNCTFQGNLMLKLYQS